MDFFKSRSLYQEIDPIPQRGRKKCLHYGLIGAFGLCLGAIMVIVLVNSFSTESSANTISPANDSDGGPLLQASAPGYDLGAEAPAEGNPGAVNNPAAVAPPAEVDSPRLSQAPAAVDSARPLDTGSRVNNTGNSSPAVVEVTTSTATGASVVRSTEARDIASQESTTASPPPEDVLIELEQGSIRGKRMISRGGREYLAFLGVPYAKPPLGALRFQPPVEAEAWNGTLNATSFKPDCLQKDKYNPEVVTKGDEDCLYVNVYTPKTLADVKKRFDFRRFPCMVYIHGGGPTGSATRYGADYFMDEDVVLVTFHYRLGVLGNLNTNDSEARGNQGLKDQVMVLQWVQDNIQKFGGSKRKVSIFGNSYGSMEVTTHLISPMSSGLFKRVISQSGTILMPAIFTTNPLKSATELGQKMNCTGNTTAELVACLRNTDAKSMILSSALMNFGTTIEPPSNNTDDVFLPDFPLNILQSGGINKVGAIFGVTSGEGLQFGSLEILSSPNATKAFDENWEQATIAALNLNFTGKPETPGRIANETRKFYLGNNTLSRDIQANFSAMFTDRQFAHPANTFATFQLQKNRREKVYLYYFNEQPDKSYADPALKAYGTDQFLGAGHADELQFLFPYDPYPTIPTDSHHFNFSRMMVKLWVSFANTGEPTGADNGAVWLPIEDQKPYSWFELKNEPNMTDMLGDRMQFWDSFNLTDLYF